MIRAALAKIGMLGEQNWWERCFVWLVAGGTVVFMAISLAIGLQQSVWFDEAYSIMLAKQPAVQLVHLTAIDTHPPFYYLVLKGWASLFGFGEFALRGLSVLFAGFSVMFAGLLMRRMFGARVALLALPFIIFAPFLLRYGFEIRMYALASLIGVAATYVLVRAQQTKTGNDQRMLYLLYAALVALGVYTLYYMVLLWVAHVLWLVWVARRNKQPILASLWARAYVISIALFLPWLPAFASQVGNGALAAIAQSMTIDNLVGIVSFGFVYHPVWQLGALLSLVVVFVIAALVVMASKTFKLLSKEKKQHIVLLAMYLAVPVAILTVVSVFKPMYVERYLSHVMIGGMMFAGICTVLVVLSSRRLRWVYTVLVAVLFIGIAQVASVGNYNFQRLQAPMVKQAAAAVPECSETATVFAADPYVATELSYYLPDCNVYFYSNTPVLRGGYAPLSESPLHVGDPQKELALSKEIYYIYYDEPSLAMPKAFYKTSDIAFDALHVATFNAE
jgi:uncharacterized membrane protein